ncbi:MAG: hypothetical protein KDA53_01020 [Hyphomonas sp.]|nr:hypothetical protein [Hyphomonas sp.]
MRLAALTALALLAAPMAMATEITVGFSEDFQEKLTEDYGTREGDYLAREVREDVEAALAKAGVDVARVDITIIDAIPNKPTFKQLSDTPGLDYGASQSIGGMKFSAVAFDADGAETSHLDYKWFENDIRMAGLSTWQDARRASSRFAKKLAKDLKEEPGA